MNDRQARRISREVTPTERERLQKLREQIAEELPEMTARDQLRKEFLTGERTLRSDVMDRLANALNYRMAPMPSDA